jgi:hypothetical protein
MMVCAMLIETSILDRSSQVTPGLACSLELCHVFYPVVVWLTWSVSIAGKLTCSLICWYPLKFLCAGDV